jgi:hypothetical protein
LRFWHRDTKTSAFWSAGSSAERRESVATC